MIRFIRSARIKNAAKYGEAMGFAKEISGYVKKYGGPEVKVFLDAFGQVSTLRWIADYESLAQMDEIQSKVLADAEYWKVVAKAADLFIEGEVEDLALREI